MWCCRSSAGSSCLTTGTGTGTGTAGRVRGAGERRSQEGGEGGAAGAPQARPLSPGPAGAPLGFTRPQSRGLKQIIHNPGGYPADNPVSKAADGRTWPPRPPLAKY
ncbi:hypothetical protein E7W42_15025 [Cronobacter sakazakii]|nr:hypothetical protein [Cronobacter sakazakii]